MSVYAFNPDRREVIATWPANVGALAHVVARAGPGVSERDATYLCAELSRLSAALWNTYVRPASAAVGEHERTRREYERERLDTVSSAVRKPNLPDESGLLVVSYSPVEESANRLGRLLHHLAIPSLTEAVLTEVAIEVDAVARAELGDLTSRAVQATALDRLDASPIQVSAADELLRADPLGEDLLSASVDPAAACVAAAHWLCAAAVVAADAAGNTPAGVFAEADDIQPVSVQVPSQVVERIENAGQSPREVVLDLLRVAVAAADGEIAELPAVLAERARLEELVSGLPADQRTAALAAEPARTTPLDPRRPARDLLEHLLDGIASCHLLYADHDDDDDDDIELVDEYGDSGEEDPDVDGRPDLDGDVEADDGRREQIAEEFAVLVRERAAATRTVLN